ncbi:hypothetical protein ACWD33_14990 [Streptomyces xiamenensis]|uniref:SH3 domain-containing protein n=1 Tax=Streptomyces xiamenensis TaxID=408015 RepID=A0A0F7CPG9_9ACTN|nr:MULTISPECIES: hypothetical protein [Streptomyces]AKG44641.1 hypothetical protein SXIM_32570 [Streptomyces xiamenensis]
MRNSCTKVLMAVAAGLLLTGASVGPAVAAPQSAPAAPAAATMATGNITTWVQGNVRKGASTSYNIAYTVKANQQLMGVCWLTGGTVDANGISHNKWVKLSDGNYIWGGLLKGNETGGISTKC